MIIDIEAMRSPRRETPQVSFRRNDNDRRNADVVLRPNDGPGRERERVAREIAERLAKKTSTTQAETVAGATNRTPEFEANLLLCLVQIKNGAETIHDISPVFDIGVERVRDHLAEALRRGLVSKAVLPRQGRSFNVWTLTNTGRAALSEAGQ